MKDQIVKIALDSAVVLVPVLAAMLIALIAKGIAWLGTKTKNATILHLLGQLEQAADTAVSAAQQLVLDKLKGVQPTAPQLDEAKSTAMAAMKIQLGPKGVAQVKDAFGLHSDRDLEQVLSNHIEANINQKKAAMRAGGAS